MRICIISNYHGKLNEGIGNLSFNIAKVLSINNDILLLRVEGVNSLMSINFWTRLANFDPQIIHYIRGPSMQSLILLRFMRLVLPNSKTIVSTTQPKFSSFSEKLIRFFKPNLVLTQSLDSEVIFKRAGCDTNFIPNGVNIKKFKPVSYEEKLAFRAKYCISPDKFIILHVGHIKKGRNIQSLCNLNNEYVQVLIVGSTRMHVEEDLYYNLIKCGCMILMDYFENIEDIYVLSDCYIFPTIDKHNSIEMPLSVMEAMSCNLPVISTRYGALEEIFSEGDGLYYVDSEIDVLSSLNSIMNGSGTNINTRSKVLNYSWEYISEKLNNSYFKTLRKE